MVKGITYIIIMTLWVLDSWLRVHVLKFGGISDDIMIKHSTHYSIHTVIRIAST